jgi:cytochrome P450
MPASADERLNSVAVDISTAAFWAKPFAERDESFAWLRANAPVSYHPPLEHTGMMRDMTPESNFWAVTRAADIHYVSQHPELFSSAQARGQSTPSDNGQLLSMDPPKHTRHRKMLSAAFTPKGVSRIAHKIEERSQEIVEAVVGGGEFDFVQAVSSKLPMMTVADIVGVPESQIEAFTQAGNNVMNLVSAEAELPPGVDLKAFYSEQMAIFQAIGVDLVHYRRKHPADDIATALAEAQPDGRPLTDQEILTVMVLLSAAGNDTTKHTTSWTTLAFAQNPDQGDWLLEDYDGRIGGAVEEFVRYATVVITFSRVATRDLQLNAVPIREGDRLSLFYCSGNRDEALFSQPERFDSSRPRSNHVAFGGRGPHFCLGNVVAKAQLRALFRHILTRLPNLEVTAEPEFLHSDFINGVRRLPVRV